MLPITITDFAAANVKQGGTDVTITLVMLGLAITIFGFALIIAAICFSATVAFQVPRKW